MPAAPGRRAPTTLAAPTSCGNTPGWRRTPTRRRTPSGQKKPNGFGICDLYGNVSEWCEDVYSPTYYKESPAVDPHGPPNPGKDVKRVIRGGSWKSSPDQCQATARSGERTGDTDACFSTDFCGFRCVRRATPEELQQLKGSKVAQAITPKRARGSMLFHTWPFLVFLMVVLPVFFALRKTRLWLPWLTLASYFFYGWWNPYYLLLVMYSTLLDFGLVALMDHCPHDGREGGRDRAADPAAL